MTLPVTATKSVLPAPSSHSPISAPGLRTRSEASTVANATRAETSQARALGVVVMNVHHDEGTKATRKGNPSTKVGLAKVITSAAASQSWAARNVQWVRVARAASVVSAEAPRGTNATTAASRPRGAAAASRPVNPASSDTAPVSTSAFGRPGSSGWAASRPRYAALWA